MTAFTLPRLISYDSDREKLMTKNYYIIRFLNSVPMHRLVPLIENEWSGKVIQYSTSDMIVSLYDYQMGILTAYFNRLLSHAELIRSEKLDEEVHKLTRNLVFGIVDHSYAEEFERVVDMLEYGRPLAFSENLSFSIVGN